MNPATAEAMAILPLLHRGLARCLLLAFLVGCQSIFTPPEPAPVTHVYIASDAAILNPDRGFFTPYDLPGPADFSSERNAGNTLVHLNIHLDDWRESGIPQELLTGLDAVFADIRKEGVKAIIRFDYNHRPDADSRPDASKALILDHIEQLAPSLQRNADVIAWVEAGFIGAWGEWHSSTAGLDTIQSKREILSALLKALPETRMVQVRYPFDIISMFPAPADAVRARVGHHNDCFLSSDTDVGTYQHDGVITIERDQTYLSELTRFTPMSGETCAPNPPRSQCTIALQEMGMLHFSAISAAYHKDILRSWVEGGCIEEIERRLGYRLTLSSSVFNEQVKPGGFLNLTVNLVNSGFASIINRRPLYVVLRPSGKTPPYKARLGIDPRRWEPGHVSFTVKLHVPSSAAEGTYRLALWLPDEYPSIRDNPLYTIQFANENTWDEATGFNLLGAVTVSKEAVGSHRPGGKFQVIVELSSSEAQK